MKELDVYILEKLKLNKDSKLPYNTDYIPTEEDYEFVEDEFGKHKFTDILFVANESYKEFDQARLMRTWIAAMQLTGSIVVEGKKLRDDYVPLIFPCHFGFRLFKYLVHHFNMDPEDILKEYDYINEDNPHDPDETFMKLLKDKIYNFVKPVFHLNSFEIELKIDDPEIYSSDCLTFMKRFNESCTVPFIVKYKDKECPCEVTFLHLSYYNYVVDGKSMRISEYFYNALTAFFNK